MKLSPLRPPEPFLMAPKAFVLGAVSSYNASGGTQEAVSGPEASIED